MVIKSLYKLMKNESANVAVEAAVIFPMIVLLIFVLLDFSRYYTASQNLNNLSATLSRHLASLNKVSENDLLSVQALIHDNSASLDLKIFYQIKIISLSGWGENGADILVDTILGGADCGSGIIEQELIDNKVRGFVPTQYFVGVRFCAIPQYQSFISSLNFLLKKGIFVETIIYSPRTGWK
ncbi:TadE/TadG family type IV pilus assembly protein [Sneathiella glossodoripedis]|uniref:TadE/TadG family type IV pilus assembly protein n=1 Tax=Sneathiella glossodoripedis TaxID=418853 RepID=UPI0004727847|nr:TadE/TadG family type IV pilus assembly protein [Sneathiella glossodoripedis]